MGGFVILSLQEYGNRISLKEKEGYRIMCLGESTTAGNEDSYPRQLEEVLNRANMGKRFIVINKGRPATNTIAIVSELENNLNKYRPDMVITMMGINDWGRSIGYNNTFFTRYLQNLRIYKLVGLLWERYYDCNKNNILRKITAAITEF